MSYADIEGGYPAGPIGLVGDLGNHNLRHAGACCRRGCSGPAMVHDGGNPAEQRLLVDLADNKAVIPIVDWREAGPAPSEDHAAALHADRFDGDAGRVFRSLHDHAAEADINRGAPASRKASSSAGSGRVSGRIHAPV